MRILPFLICSVIQMNAQLDTFLLKSKILSRTIEVFISRPNKSANQIPIVYYTDGSKMIKNGVLAKIDSLIKAGRVPLTVNVFVSSIDRKTGVDHRNEYFFCNPDYLTFFESELIPRVETYLDKGASVINRSLVGVSFGGLNAGYFSAKSSLFQNYGLLSPVTYPCEKVLQEIVFSKNQDLKIFLSTGKNDAEGYVQPLRNLYESKGYKIKINRIKGGHDFENWNGQLEVMLNHFFYE